MKNDPKQFDSDQFQSDWRDPELTRLFAERSDTLPELHFMQGFVERFERAQRQAWMRKALSLVFGVGAAACAAVWLSRPEVWRDVVPTELLSPNFSSLADPRELIALFESPITWAAGGVLLGAMLPSIFVWRALRR